MKFFSSAWSWLKTTFSKITLKDVETVVSDAEKVIPFVVAAVPQAGPAAGVAEVALGEVGALAKALDNQPSAPSAPAPTK